MGYKKPMPQRPPATAWTIPSSNASYSRTKSIAQMVRDATSGGQALIDALVEMALDPDAAYRDRTTAASILLDRGFGRAVETTLSLSVDAGSSDALSQLADAELERLAQTLAPSSVRPVVVLPAASLSPATELLPDAPPEALEAPLRPREVNAQGNVPALTTPTEALPPPLARAPRRRIVTPAPRARPAATVEAGEDAADRPDKG